MMNDATACAVRRADDDQLSAHVYGELRLIAHLIVT